MADLRVLSEAECMERIRSQRPASLNYYAFYSSFLGGVVTDPALMSIPMDDHLVHRGHGVFDTATLSNGYVYRLEIHLDRFYESAKNARLEPPCTREEMKQIILKTCALSKKKDASIRYWLGSGPGDFGIVPAPGAKCSFYVMVFGGIPLDKSLAEGIHEITIRETPLKPPYLANMKSTNYLLNALYCLEARQNGGKFGIQVDKDGKLAESAVLNISLVTKEGVLKTPKFDRILAGTTVRAAMDVAREDIAAGSAYGLTEVEQPEVTFQELLDAREAFLSGGETHIFPVTCIDGHTIGDGRVGPFTSYLIHKLEEIAASGNTTDHIKVNYDA